MTPETWAERPESCKVSSTRARYAKSASPSQLNHPNYRPTCVLIAWGEDYSFRLTMVLKCRGSGCTQAKIAGRLTLTDTHLTNEFVQVPRSEMNTLKNAIPLLLPLWL